jgi:hypothetical protein
VAATIARPSCREKRWGIIASYCDAQTGTNMDLFFGTREPLRRNSRLLGAGSGQRIDSGLLWPGSGKVGRSGGSGHEWP